jgi:hypothetical protein
VDGLRGLVDDLERRWMPLDQLLSGVAVAGVVASRVSAVAINHASGIG